MKEILEPSLWTNQEPAFLGPFSLNYPEASISLDQSEASVYICVVGLEKIPASSLYMGCGTWKNSGHSSIYMVCETPPVDKLGASIPLVPSPRDSHSSLSVVVSNGT